MELKHLRLNCIVDGNVRKKLKEYLVIQSTGMYIAFKCYFMDKRLLSIIKLEMDF